MHEFDLKINDQRTIFGLVVFTQNHYMPACYCCKFTYLTGCEKVVLHHTPEYKDDMQDILDVPKNT